MYPLATSVRLFVNSLSYQLQKFDPGMVWLDQNNIITAMNEVALETLGDYRGELIGREVLQLHPDKSREKVDFLLDKTNCPMGSPPPVTMMINIPERMLLIKVSKMMGKDGFHGACMVFYDITDMTSVPGDEPVAEPPVFSRRLLKLPVYKNKQILLIDLETVGCIQANGHYSTLHTSGDEFLCNLSLVDLEGRLDPAQFVRTHRSYIVNLSFAKALNKQAEHLQLVVGKGKELTVPISRNNVAKVKEQLGLV